MTTLFQSWISEFLKLQAKKVFFYFPFSFYLTHSSPHNTTENSELAKCMETSDPEAVIEELLSTNKVKKDCKEKESIFLWKEDEISSLLCFRLLKRVSPKLKPHLKNIIKENKKEREEREERERLQLRKVGKILILILISWKKEKEEKKRERVRERDISYHS